MGVDDGNGGGGGSISSKGSRRGRAGARGSRGRGRSAAAASAVAGSGGAGGEETAPSPEWLHCLVQAEVGEFQGTRHALSRLKEIVVRRSYGGL